MRKVSHITCPRVIFHNVPSLALFTISHRIKTNQTICFAALNLARIACRIVNVERCLTLKTFCLVDITSCAVCYVAWVKSAIIIETVSRECITRLASKAYCGISLNTSRTIIDIANLITCKSLDTVKFIPGLAHKTLAEEMNGAIYDIEGFTSISPVVKAFAVDTDVAEGAFVFA